MFTLLHTKTVAQQNSRRHSITIAIKDTANIGVSFAIVSLLTADSVGILFFNSGEDGIVSVSSDIDLLSTVKFLKVAAPGFEVFYGLFSPDLERINVQLFPDISSTMDNITIRTKNRPRLKTRGDTLSYAVRDFINKEDRTLSDILKHLPGFSVDAQGRVSFNGRPVSNLYIEGDDILGGSYERATKNIRADLLDTIQVLEHNQPIKVLQGIESTDITALNIRLKAGTHAQWFHQASAGAGSKAYDAAWSGLIVKASYKALMSASVSNVGETSNSNIKLSTIERQTQEELSTKLSSTPVSTPALPSAYWLRNQSAAATGNQLWKIDNSHQLRLIAEFNRDREQRTVSELFFFPKSNDSLLFRQSAKGKINTDFLNLNAAYIANSSSHYLEVSLQTSIAGNRSRAEWELASQHSNATHQNNLNNLQLSVIHLRQAGGSGYLKIQHLTRVEQLPEALLVTPGVFSNLINNDTPFLFASQKFTQKAFTISNSIGWHQSEGKFRQSYTAGFDLFHIQIFSALSAGLENNGLKILEDPYQRQFRGHFMLPYLSAEWQRIGERSELSTLFTLKKQKACYLLNQGNAREASSFLLPEATLSYRLSSGKENEVRIRSSYQRYTDDLSDLFNGTVLTDYRTLVSTNRQLQQQWFQKHSARYLFKKSVYIFSAYGGVSWTNQNLNNLDSYTMDTTQTLLGTSTYNYKTSEWQFNGGASKYLFFLKTTVNLRVQYSLASAERLQNGLLIPFSLQKNAISLGWNWQPHQSFYLAYNMERKAGKIKGITGFKNWHHQASAFAQITPAISVKAGFAYFNNNINHYTSKLKFTETLIRFTIPNKKIDIEMEGKNIFNEQSFQWISLDEGFIHITDYQLRPRTLLVRIRLNL